MRRRALLTNASALGALTAFAGCLNTEGGDETTTEETTTTTTDETTTEETTTTDETTTDETTTQEPTTTVEPLAVDSMEIQTETTACGTKNDGTIEFTDNGATMTISGSIPTKTPCYEAKYVGQRLLGDVVQITVGTEQTDAENCQTCLGHVEYTGTVKTNRIPHSLVLVHEYTPEDKDEPITDAVADKAPGE